MEIERARADEAAAKAPSEPTRITVSLDIDPAEAAKRAAAMQEEIEMMRRPELRIGCNLDPRLQRPGSRDALSR